MARIVYSVGGQHAGDEPLGRVVCFCGVVFVVIIAVVAYPSILLCVIIIIVNGHSRSCEYFEISI